MIARIHASPGVLSGRILGSNPLNRLPHRIPQHRFAPHKLHLQHGPNHRARPHVTSHPRELRPIFLRDHQRLRPAISQRRCQLSRLPITQSVMIPVHPRSDFLSCRTPHRL